MDPNDIPDSYPPDNIESGDVPITIGSDPDRAIVLFSLRGQTVGFPVGVALKIAHSINSKALEILFMPRVEDDQESDDSGLIVP